MDPVECLENEIRKAHRKVNKESVQATFFNIEKAYDMLWKELLLITFLKMGIGENIQLEKKIKGNYKKNSHYKSNGIRRRRADIYMTFKKKYQL